MAGRIIWAPRAVADLEDICAFIAKDSEHYASIFAAKIFEIITRIPEFPESGRIVPEYKNKNIREKIYRNYRIVYRLKDNIVEIAGICHSTKMLEDVS